MVFISVRGMQLCTSQNLNAHAHYCHPAMSSSKVPLRICQQSILQQSCVLYTSYRQISYMFFFHCETKRGWSTHIQRQVLVSSMSEEDLAEARHILKTERNSMKAVERVQQSIVFNQEKLRGNESSTGLSTRREKWGRIEA